MANTIIGADTYQTFGTVAEATTYLNGSDSPSARSWRTASADSQARGLVSATRLIIAEGLVYLDLPIDVTTAPVPILEAAWELAALLVKSPALADAADTGKNIASIGAGSASVSFFSPTDGERFPFSVMSRLAAYYPASGAAGIVAGSQSTGTGACSRFEDFDLRGGQ